MLGCRFRSIKTCTVQLLYSSGKLTNPNPLISLAGYFGSAFALVPVMDKIQAPEGYEGCVFWDDGAREYKAAFRLIGASWWTNCYHPAGHQYLTANERKNRAEAAILHAISLRTEKK